ncbi:unnamed protein product [Gemmata massiliana]|uniref:Uncharacterized protein n=1 Tax=Gemmata massiliana TaxID=1210884 RepID=A0A6P2D3S9_9BACT|nr:unnamed protein product [Gemmata massiliana]
MPARSLYDELATGSRPAWVARSDPPAPGGARVGHVGGAGGAHEPPGDRPVRAPTRAPVGPRARVPARSDTGRVHPVPVRPQQVAGSVLTGMPCSVSGMSPRRGRGLCAGRQGQPTRVGDRHRSRVGVRGRCPRDQCGHFPLSRSPRPSNWAPGHDGRQGARRLEPRTLRTNPILTAHDRWKGLKQGFRMTRTRTGGGATTLEVVYGITSLSPAGRRASPSGMGSVLLAHREPTALRARCDPTRGCMPRAPGPLHRCSRPRATPGSTDSPPLPPNAPRSLSASPARITQRPWSTQGRLVC